MQTNISNIHLLTPAVNQTEQTLLKMRKLDTKIKALESEYNMLKSQVLADHFATHDEYKTVKGLVLATYKASEVMQFQQTKFKEAHADLYLRFTEEKTQFRFLLKK